MDKIFDALNPENQNDVLDCCNGNLKCKEKEFLKNCISGKNKNTFTFVPPELPCNISPVVKKFIYSSALEFTKFLNDNTDLLIESIGKRDFDLLGASLPSNLNIAIFSVNARERIYTSEPGFTGFNYETVFNNYASSRRTLPGRGSSVAFTNFFNKSIGPLIRPSSSKSINKNTRENKIKPFAVEDADTVSFSSTSVSAETTTTNPCATSVELVDEFIICGATVPL
jgi:hypothetical protein